MDPNQSFTVSIQHPLFNGTFSSNHPAIVHLLTGLAAQLGPAIQKYGPLILEALLASGALAAKPPS